MQKIALCRVPTTLAAWPSERTAVQNWRLADISVPTLVTCRVIALFYTGLIDQCCAVDIDHLSTPRLHQTVAHPVYLQEEDRYEPPLLCKM